MDDVKKDNENLFTLKLGHLGEVLRSDFNNLSKRFDEFQIGQRELIKALEQNQTVKIEQFNREVVELKNTLHILKDDTKQFAKSQDLNGLLDQQISQFIATRLRGIIDSAIDNELESRILKLRTDLKDELAPDDANDVTKLKLNIKDVIAIVIFLGSLLSSYFLIQGDVKKANDGVSDFKSAQTKYDIMAKDFDRLVIQFEDAKSKIAVITDNTQKIDKQIQGIDRKQSEFELMFLKK